MKIKEYLNESKFYYTEYLTLLENESALISKGLYAGLYNYYFNIRGESYHVLTQNLSMTMMMKPEFYILTNNSGLNNSVVYCDIKYKIRLDSDTLTIILVIKDDPKNPLEVPFIYSLNDPGINFELSKLLEQDTIDIFFVETRDGMLYQRNFRQISFNEKEKIEIRDYIQQFLDMNDEIESFEEEIDFGEMLESDSIDYLNIVIDREDVENLNIAKYIEMLDPLYPSKLLTNKFCENVALFIDGYDNDSRDLWNIPEVRKFVEALNEEFCYWLYFLDKKVGSLMWITLALVGNGKGDKLSIDNELFNTFLHHQMVYLNEVCMFCNGTEEKLEELRNNTYGYFGMH